MRVNWPTAILLFSGLTLIHADQNETAIQTRSEHLLPAVVRQFIVSEGAARYFRKIDPAILVISTNPGPDGIGWNQMWSFQRGIHYDRPADQRVQRATIPVFENDEAILIHIFIGYENGFGLVDWQKKFRVEDKLGLYYFIETKTRDDALTKTLDSIIVRLIGAGPQALQQPVPSREGQ